MLLLHQIHRSIISVQLHTYILELLRFSQYTITMQFTLSIILCLASVALSIPTPQSGGKTGGLDFIPGLTIPPSCRTPSGSESIICPAKLSTGNALLTARNIAVNELTGASKLSANVLRVGWTFQDNRAIEESTLAIFDFPRGQKNKQCKFQFVTDGERDGGDLSTIPAGYFNVWQLERQTGVVGEESTFFNKPARDTVLATFTTDPNRESYTTRNGKHIHGFVFGPGEVSTGVDESPTFPCPPPGRIAFEVASAIKTSGKLTRGNFININGHAGLGIEILGLRSEF
jgi:hypothetical protein